MNFADALKAWNAYTEQQRETFRRAHGGTVTATDWDDLEHDEAGIPLTGPEVTRSPLQAPGGYSPAELDRGYPDDEETP